MENDRFKMFRQTSSSTSQAAGKSGPAAYLPPPCSELTAAKFAELLLGCFRKGEAENPEVYCSAVATVLAGYPEAVVLRVTHPSIGLPGRLHWLPTVAEVKQACEREMKPLHEQAEREERDAERISRLQPARADRETRAAAVTKLRLASVPIEKLCRESDVNISSLPDRPDNAKRLGEILVGWSPPKREA